MPDKIPVPQTILPGETLGMLGGGQLGRMFVVAARSMGYEVIVLDPDPDSPAGSMATEHLEANFNDKESLDYLASQCRVISTEFENIPAENLEYLAQSRPVHPSAEVIRIAQNRIKEKNFIRDLGLNTVDFVAIESEQDLAELYDFDFPAIMKTATLGYDGKGQVVCHSATDVKNAFNGLKQVSCVLEKKIDLALEVSVVLSRNQIGEINCFPIAENTHLNGILDTSIVPARLNQKMSDQVIEAAKKIAHGLDYVGVMAVEFFVSTDEQILINEIAPRPHNSGHYTLDACRVSQFEQQVRAICNLPSGNCNLQTPVVMWNILGDLWPENDSPNWEKLLFDGNAKLYLYGKKQARLGRKMGHVNFLAENVAAAQNKLKLYLNQLD